MDEEIRDESIRTIVQRAANIAMDAPETLRVAVFSKVFEHLVGDGQGNQVRSGASSVPSTADDVPAEQRTRKSRASTGPKGFAMRLYEGGFFEQPRAVEAVAEHINLNFARSFASKDLSKALIRMVQDGTLRREKLEEGKLAYVRI